MADITVMLVFLLPFLLFLHLQYFWGSVLTISVHMHVFILFSCLKNSSFLKVYQSSARPRPILETQLCAAKFLCSAYILLSEFKLMLSSLLKCQYSKPLASSHLRPSNYIVPISFIDLQIWLIRLLKSMRYQKQCLNNIKAVSHTDKRQGGSNYHWHCPFHWHVQKSYRKIASCWISMSCLAFNSVLSKL